MWLALRWGVFMHQMIIKWYRHCDAPKTRLLTTSWYTHAVEIISNCLIFFLKYNKQQQQIYNHTKQNIPPPQVGFLFLKTEYLLNYFIFNIHIKVRAGTHKIITKKKRPCRRYIIKIWDKRLPCSVKFISWPSRRLRKMAHVAASPLLSVCVVCVVCLQLTFA